MEIRMVTPKGEKVVEEKRLLGVKFVTNGGRQFFVKFMNGGAVVSVEGGDSITVKPVNTGQIFLE